MIDRTRPPPSPPTTSQDPSVGHLGRYGEPHAGSLACPGDLVVVKARVCPQGELAGSTGDPYPGEDLAQEAGRTPGRMRVASALAHAEHVALVWRKTADEILDSLGRYCSTISDSGH
jgi:hypothetical protein